MDPERVRRLRFGLVRRRGGARRSMLRRTAETRPIKAVTRIFGGPLRTARRRRRGARPEQSSAVVDSALYIGGLRQPGHWPHLDGLAAARRRTDAFVWVGVHEPTEAELKAIGFSFQLNAAAVEEALDDGLRPKVEQYDGTTLIVLRPVRYVEPADATRDGEVETAAIVIFCGVHFLITVRYGEAAALRQVRRDLESHPELLRQGAWSVVCGIAERVVDEYLSVAHEVECDLDELEARVLEMDSRQAIARLRQFKRGIVDFKRAVLPLQRPLGALVAGHPVIIPAGLAPFLRGASDRLGLAAEQVRSFDDLLNYLMTSHLATIDVEQNRDMRKIAAWASVAALWGIVAGIYEMTQDFTSLHRDHNGLMFGGTVAATAITSILLYLRFRRAGWL